MRLRSQDCKNFCASCSNNYSSSSILSLSPFFLAVGETLQNSYSENESCLNLASVLCDYPKKVAAH